MVDIKSEKEGITTVREVQTQDSDSIRHADNARLAELGYKSEFKREFSVRVRYAIFRGESQPLLQLIETIAFAFSIMGVVASVTSTFSFPLVSGILLQLLMSLYAHQH
jgi:hypothetical protein